MPFLIDDLIIFGIGPALVAGMKYLLDGPPEDNGGGHSPAPRWTPPTSPQPPHYAQRAASGRPQAHIPQARNGHFYADVVFAECMTIPMMIDSGATHCVLRHDFLHKLGLGHKLAGIGWTGQIGTASGIVRTVEFPLSHLRIGDVVVSDVSAILLEHDTDEYLLGQSFLARLSSYEVRGGVMTLRG